MRTTDIEQVDNATAHRELTRLPRPFRLQITAPRQLRTQLFKVSAIAFFEVQGAGRERVRSKRVLTQRRPGCDIQRW